MKLLIFLSSMVSIYYFFFAEVTNDGKLKVFPINFDKLIGTVLSIFLIILMTINRTGYDAISFIRFFNFVKIKHVNLWDYTYELLTKLINITISYFPNLNYFEFHALILTITGILFVYPFLKINAKSYSAVLSLYILSGTFAYDGMQFKNFIAVTLLLIALTVLFLYNRVGIILFYLLILLSIRFHFSFAIYLLLPLVKIKNIKNKSNQFAVFGIFSYLIMFVIGPIVRSKLLLVMSTLPFMSKLAVYANQNNGLRSIIPVIIYILILITISYFHKNSEKFSTQSKILLDVTYHIWSYLGLVLPFLIFANAPYRMLRNMFILVFVSFVNGILELPRTSVKRMYGIGLVLTVALIIFCYPILIKQAIDVYQPIVENPVFFWQD